MIRTLLLILLFITPMHSWACDNKNCDLHKFSFNEDDLISWTPSILTIQESYEGKNTERKENTILFYFKPKKTQELVELAKKIADAVNTENNLAVFFKDHLISELRIPAPFPDFPDFPKTDSFHLKINDQDYQNVIMILPQEKRLSENKVPE